MTFGTEPKVTDVFTLFFLCLLSILSDSGLQAIRDRIPGGSIVVEKVRLPYAVDTRGSVTYAKTKSYIWWMDDPWAALIALAAIIILLCIVGIIVIIFTYAR